MKSNATKFLSGLLFGVLIFVLAVDAALLAASPFWVHTTYQSGYLSFFGASFSEIPIGNQFHSEWFMMAFVIVSGFVLGALVVESMRLLMNVRRGEPFCMRNAIALRNAAWCCTAEFGLFVAKLVDGITVLSLGCTIIFLVASMLYFVLADLFRAAALLREDHDLTI